MIVAFAFLNPLLLWALPLAAVPIVIHLLNRRRFDTRRWAAMEFLLRAMKRNRRRLRMEQWLVLLLRTLAVLLLVLIVSRPQLSGNVLGAARTHHVVAIDDSASMAHRGGADDAFGRAIDALHTLSGRLANERSGDLFTLLRASDPDRPALAAVPIGPGLAQRVRDAAAAWTVGDGALDAAATLAAAGRRADEAPEAGRTEFYLLTDLRRRDWLTADGQPIPGVVTALLAFGDSRHLSLIDVGARDGENLSVTAVRCADRVAVAGVPVTIEVAIRNRGRAASAPTELGIAVDDQSRVVRPVPPIAPGETATIAFDHTFHTPGSHCVVADVAADRYAVDDLRALALRVRPASSVLLVDGDPGADLEESETFFLNVALDPGGETRTGIEPRTIGDHELATLADEEFANVDLIFLCNVSRPDDRAVERLEQFVAAGGGVVVFLGNQVDIGRYNAVMWKDGRGLLPAPLLEVDGDMDDPRHVFLAMPEHELFAANTEEVAFMFQRTVHVGRWIASGVEPTSPADVLLRIHDADGPALMVAHSVAGGGRVFVIGSSADAHWTDLCIRPVFPILINELHAAAARPQDFARDNFLPHDTLDVTVDPGVFRSDVTVEPLGAAIEARTFAPDGAATGELSVRIPLPELEGYGVFAVKREAHAGGTDVRFITRNPLIEEGDLEPLPGTHLLATYPDEVRTALTIRSGASEAAARAEASTSGMWRWLGLLMLVGMLAETVLAWRFGRR